MNGENQQAYDRGVSIFSPDGRLYQVEYAREAVKQGAPSVGVRAEDGVVLAARRRVRSDLLEARSVEKLHAVDDHVAVGTAGQAADARRLVDIARRAAQRNRLRYDEPATVEALSTTVADHVQERTQTGGARPYGTSLLVAGVDAAGPHAGEPRLFETDVSGTHYEWQAVAVGRDSQNITDHLEDAYEAGLSVGDALDLAVRALAAPADELGADEVVATTVTADGVDPVDDETLSAALAEAGVDEE